MSARLSVIFYIILCLEIGIVLTVLPWIPQGFLGLSDWGNNYFLLYAARKLGSYSLQSVVASGWIRGAVTGVGILNLGMAFWEIFHFKQTVYALQGNYESAKGASQHAAQSAAQSNSADHLPDHERQDNTSNDPSK